VVDASLLTGPLPWTLVGAGVLGGALLLARRSRAWWSWAVPSVLAAVAVVVAALMAVTTWVWHPFPDVLPASVWLCVGAGLAGLGLGAVRLAPRSGAGVHGRVAGLAGAVLVLLAAAEGVNLHYGSYPTVRTVLGLPYPDQVEFADTPAHAARLTDPTPGTPFVRSWSPPPDMPPVGRVAQVTIPAPVSRFAARPAWIYLPPAYLGSVRARLPVLVLLSGQPGSPDDWLTGGDLAARLDEFAALHRGLAPIVVMPDPLGSPLANPLCLDSRLGNAATYLRVDVPAWAAVHLQAQPVRAVGGFSSGGRAPCRWRSPHRASTPTSSTSPGRPSRHSGRTGRRSPPPSGATRPRSGL
jgi:hypothetical protein